MRTCRLLFFLMALAFGSSSFGSTGWAKSPVSCRVLFAQKLFWQAAICFQRKIHDSSIKAKGADTKKPQTIVLYQNAIQSLTLASQKQGGPIQKAYFRQQAVRLLRIFLKRKYCSSQDSCRSYRIQVRQLEQQRSIAGLEVQTYHPKAQIEVLRVWLPWQKPARTLTKRCPIGAIHSFKPTRSCLESIKVQRSAGLLIKAINPGYYRGTCPISRQGKRPLSQDLSDHIPKNALEFAAYPLENAYGP